MISLVYILGPVDGPQRTTWRAKGDEGNRVRQGQYEERAREGFSLAAQEAKLRAYADLYDIELVAVLVDAGVSAKTLNRPALQQALAALNAGEAEGILIAKLDRLTRSARDLGALLDEFFGSRFSLLSVGDQIDTRTAGGRLVLNILASVSQWEREAIGERTRVALAQKKAQGARLGAPALKGEAVVRIHQLRDQGLTLRAIVAALDAEGVRTLRGGKWAPETVRKVLGRAA